MKKELKMKKYVWLRSNGEWTLLGSGNHTNMVSRESEHLCVAWSNQKDRPEGPGIQYNNWENVAQIGLNDTVLITNESGRPTSHE